MTEGFWEDDFHACALEAGFLAHAAGRLDDSAHVKRLAYEMHGKRLADKRLRQERDRARQKGPARTGPPLNHLLEYETMIDTANADPDGMNNRASWTETALATFIDMTGADEQDASGDLLAALDRACMPYEAETAEEGAA